MQQEVMLYYLLGHSGNQGILFLQSLKPEGKIALCLFAANYGILFILYSSYYRRKDKDAIGDARIKSCAHIAIQLGMYAPLYFTDKQEKLHIWNISIYNITYLQPYGRSCQYTNRRISTAHEALMGAGVFGIRIEGSYDFPLFSKLFIKLIFQ